MWEGKKSHDRSRLGNPQNLRTKNTVDHTQFDRNILPKTQLKSKVYYDLSNG